MSRKLIRQRLVTLFTNTGSFNQVLGYAPLDLQGKTKVLCIFTDSSYKDMMSKAVNNDFYSMVLDVYVKRENSVTHEDDLDDLHDVIETTVRANVGDSNWDNLELNTPSDAYFAEVSGKPYRVERHILLIKETN